MNTFVHAIVGICFFMSSFTLMEGKNLYSIKTVVNSKGKSKIKVIPYYSMIDYGSSKYREIIDRGVWHYDEDPPTPHSIPKYETQCSGVAYLLLKGKAKNLDIYVKCKNGKIIYKKSNISVNGSTKVIVSKGKVDLFSGCSQKFDEDQHFYEEYDVFIEEDGQVIFQAEIIRRECYE